MSSHGHVTRAIYARMRFCKEGEPHIHIEGLDGGGNVLSDTVFAVPAFLEASGAILGELAADMQEFMGGLEEERAPDKPS